MGQVVTKSFKKYLVDQIEESFDESQNTFYYLGAHRSNPYDDEQNPPEPDTSVLGFNELFSELLFGKRIRKEDFSFLIRRIEWQFQTVYDSYDHTDPDLHEKNFYVAAPEANDYHVFKCLDNNGNSESTHQPKFSETSDDDDLYKTDDGYSWKYMFSITQDEWKKFTTSEMIPITRNANVISSSISGSIDAYKITAQGTQYNNYAEGQIKATNIAGNTLIHSLSSDSTVLSANTDFYKYSALYIDSGSGMGQIKKINEYIVTGSERYVLLDSEFDTSIDGSSTFRISPLVEIEGDGSGALALSTVDPFTANSISSVEIINRGEGYTYAEVNVSANTGLVNSNGDVVITDSADVEAVISPDGGHGSQPELELYSSSFGISVDFNGNELGTIPDTNEYRKVSLIRDPIFERQVLLLDSSATAFTSGEIVSQENGATAKVFDRDSNTLTVSDIKGEFVQDEEITGADSGNVATVENIDRSIETFDQREIFSIEMIYAGTDGLGFIEDSEVTQEQFLATGRVHSANSSVISLTNVRNDFQVSDSVSGVINTIKSKTNNAEAKLIAKDVSRNRVNRLGLQYLIVDTFSSISRDADQKEQIKLTVEL